MDISWRRWGNCAATSTQISRACTMRFIRNNAVVVSVVFTAIMIYFGNYFVTPSLLGLERLENLCRPRTRLEFIVNKWKEASFESGDRYRMANDILRHDRLKNLKADEVKELLGEADFVETTRSDFTTYYCLAAQQRFPSKSIFYPNRF